MIQTIHWIPFTVTGAKVFCSTLIPVFILDFFLSIYFLLLLTGVISVLTNVRQFNDLAHPLCRNLRDGDWLMDYVVARLLPCVGTRQVSLALFV